jgi:hypothetical protein
MEEYQPARPLDLGSPDYEEEDVQRRRLLMDLTAIGIAPQVASMEQLRHHLLSGLDVAEPIEEWERVVWEYGTSYAATSPHLLLQDLSADLLAADARLRQLSRNDSGRRDMYRVIARLAVLAAHTFANLTMFRASQRWWRVARSYSDRSHDNQLRMWIRGREVIGAIYEQRPLEQALQHAVQALEISASPGMGTGSVLAGQAQVLALLGRSRDAHAALSQAQAAFERLPQSVVADTDSLFGWPEHRLRHTESFVHTHAGSATDAIRAQDRALDLYSSDMIRERAQIQLHRAQCIIQTGDSRAGAAHAAEALTCIPPDQRTQVVMAVARSVVRAIPARDLDGPEVTDLCELLPPPWQLTPTRLR